MKSGKLIEEHKILNEDGEIYSVKKFSCPDDLIFEKDGQQYLKLFYTDNITFLLPVEDVEYFSIEKGKSKEEEIPAKTKLRKIFSKKSKEKFG